MAGDDLDNQTADASFETPLGEVIQPWVHPYVSAACLHAVGENRPGLHASCRSSCKYAPGGSPEYCRCSCHPQDPSRAAPVSWVDQAREVALELLDGLRAAGVDLPGDLAERIEGDPALFWLRGEIIPPGEWKDPGRG